MCGSFVCYLPHFPYASKVENDLVPQVWNNVQQNHPYDTLSNFQGQAKKGNACIEMYG